jgi:inosose dehydratase
VESRDVARIGINPLTWSNDDLPSLGADIPLETCLAEAREAGYQGVELGHKFPRKAEVLAPLLRRHGLALVSGWYSARLLERDAVAEFAAMADHFALLRKLECEVMVLAEVTGCIHGDQHTRLSRRPHLPPARWAEFGARMTSLAEKMRAEGLRLAYHHHMGTVVQSAHDIEQLIRHTGDAVGLLLDTGHLTFAGEDPARVANAHAQRIVHVHCKDVRREVLTRCLNRDSSFLDAVVQGVFTVPGDGCVDYPRVIQPIRRGGYDGWWVVEAEQDPAVAEPRRYARMGYEYLSRTLAA